jgi:hypothetical protein
MQMRKLGFSERNLLYAIFTVTASFLYGLIIIFVIPFEGRRFSVLIIIGQAITFVLFFYFVSRIGKEKEIEARRLLRHGVQGTATVLAAKQTGVLVDKRWEVEMKLRVQPDQGEPYEQATRYFIPMFHLSALRLNTTVKVKIDPLNAARMAIDESWAERWPLF